MIINDLFVTQPLGWLGRNQSPVRLLPAQILGVRLPLLSPAFRHSNLRGQVPPRLHEARDPSSEGWNYGREYCPVNLAEMTTSTPFWDLLHAAKYDMGPTALLPLQRKVC